MTAIFRELTSKSAVRWSSAMVALARQGGTPADVRPIHSSDGRLYVCRRSASGHRRSGRRSVVSSRHGKENLYHRSKRQPAKPLFYLTTWRPSGIHKLHGPLQHRSRHRENGFRQAWRSNTHLESHNGSECKPAWHRWLLELVDNRVTYTSDVVDRDEVYTVSAKGGIPRRITNRPGYLAFEPSFSPILSDGSQWIVFESHRATRPDCCGEIWKVRTDGARPARLTTGANDRQPEWSPQGDKIVFQREVTPGNWDVFPIDIDEGSLFNVTNNPTSGNTDCSWSPSGHYIVYSAGGPSINIANLFIIPALGGASNQRTDSCGLDGAPGWSPDGSKIAFESAPFDPDVKGSTAIWIINAPPGVK